MALLFCAALSWQHGVPFRVSHPSPQRKKTIMFEAGKSGNPAGRPKKDKSRLSSIKEAWEDLCSGKPYLIKEALERGLRGQRPLGFLELGARVMKEIGQAEEQKSAVTIVFNSSLNTSALRPVVAEPVRILETTAHPALSEAKEVDMSLLEILDESRE